jgi:hypothetical protein
MHENVTSPHQSVDTSFKVIFSKGSLFSNFKIVKLFVVKAFRFFLKTEIEITPAGYRPGSDCSKVTPSPSNFFAFPFPLLRDIAIRNTFAANCARFDS